MPSLGLGLGIQRALMGRGIPVPVFNELIFDEFTDTNGTLLTAHTIAPTNTISGAWAFISQSFDIQSGKAITSAAGGRVVVDAGISDGFIASIDTTIADQGGVLLRAFDNDNWIGVTVSNSTSKFSIYKRVAGSVTNLFESSALSATPSAVVLKVTVNGEHINVNWNDGEKIADVYVPELISNELHGLYGGISNATADNFKLIESNLVLVAPAAFTETTGTTRQSEYIQTSVAANWSMSTDASKVVINGFTNYPIGSIGLAKLGYRINGGAWSNLGPSAVGAFQGVITMPSGTNTLEIINGSQSKSGSTVIGTWVESAYPSDGSVFTADTNPSNEANQIILYGDSITAGGNSTNRPYEGYGVVLRGLVSNPVTHEAWGQRTLNDDCSTAGAIDTFVAKIAAVTPTIVWLGIGTNDYGLAAQTAASFEAQYDALLADLVVALPSAKIYCATPIHRTVETANGLGDTLGDYRTAISNAVTTIADADVTFVDTSAWLVDGDLDDGVHPTTAGHVIMAAQIDSVLNP